MNEKALKPPVILLGGAPGTGKTTLANLLVSRLTLAHHLSTGFIRASIRPFISSEEADLIRLDSYDAWKAVPTVSGTTAPGLLQGLIKQSQVIAPAVNECIKRALDEGIGLVIEGTQLVPGVFEDQGKGITLFCLLDVPNHSDLVIRSMGRNHVSRQFTTEQKANLGTLQSQLVRQATACKVPVIANENLELALQTILSHLDSRIPITPDLTTNLGP